MKRATCVVDLVFKYKDIYGKILASLWGLGKGSEELGPKVGRIVVEGGVGCRQVGVVVVMM
ncbi:MAG: hypothetical protein AAFY71_25095 [Bacteroidota bacterium]